MNALKKLFIVLTILFNTSSFAQVNFISNDWEQAKAKAKQENKYIFMDCYTDWCSWCKVMDRETFTDKNVIETLNSQMISAKIDMEKGTGITLAMKYNVSGFPTSLIFNSEGRLVYRSIGYQKPDQFMTTLKTALGTTDFIKGYSDKIDLNYPSFYHDVCDGDKNTKSPKEEVVLAYLDKQNDLFSELNWNIIKRFRLPGKYKNYFLENMEKYRQLYGDAEVSEEVDATIQSDLNEAIKGKSEEKFKEVLNRIDKIKGDEAEAYKQDYRLMYYRGTENCAAYAKAAKEQVDKSKETDAAMLNSCSWTIYEICDDAATIKMATGWMTSAIEKDPSYANLDTYAALLYKGKEYSKAQKYALLAIETGKKDGEKVNETEELLIKINAALQK